MDKQPATQESQERIAKVLYGIMFTALILFVLWGGYEFGQWLR